MNTEIYSMNEEFSGHQSEQKDAYINSASVDLERSVEVREEEAIVREYFDGSPCCALEPKKGPSWIHAGRKTFLQARQESFDLEKKDLQFQDQGVHLNERRDEKDLKPSTYI